ncbi:MAG TPA: glycerophosphodiester phosphodiesterase [Anaeromyxobacteraceae bacterium]|nr:glycerophosphodiester phosphodiesterase [Anaeromyxobacteraceae bacterium]
MKPYLDRPRPWLVAHRGGARLAPENTLPAFALAARLSADAFELDVQLTADGEVVVFHDEETTRLTGSPGTISGRTLAEVRALDAGFHFSGDGGRTFPFRGQGLSPPTLRELIALYPGQRMNIEAKSPDPALARALASAVKEAGAVDRVCLGSEHDEQGERLRALLPEACHFLPREAATRHVVAARIPGATQGPPGYEVADLPLRFPGSSRVLVDGAVVEHFHRQGLSVFVWTVDEESDMRALLAAGVDGIMTDRPDLLSRVLGRPPPATVAPG